MAFDEPTSTIHQINQRLAALEAQVAYLSQALGVSPGAQAGDRKSTRLNSSHYSRSRMPSSA